MKQPVILLSLVIHCTLKTTLIKEGGALRVKAWKSRSTVTIIVGLLLTIDFRHNSTHQKLKKIWPYRTQHNSIRGWTMSMFGWFCWI